MPKINLMAMTKLFTIYSNGFPAGIMKEIGIDLMGKIKVVQEGAIIH